MNQVGGFYTENIYDKLHTTKGQPCPQCGARIYYNFGEGAWSPSSEEPIREVYEYLRCAKCGAEYVLRTK